jgi:hypothetical protein
MRLRLVRVALALVCALTLVSPARADQSPVLQPSSGPKSMSDLVSNYLNPALRSLLSNSAGPSAPANGPGGAPLAFQWWVDQSSAPHALRLYDGGQWVEIGALDPSTHTFFAKTRTPDVLGLAPVATTGSASDLTAGMLPAARLPLPAELSKGAVFATPEEANKFATGLGADGRLIKRRPEFTDISGLAQVASSGASNDVSYTQPGTGSSPSNVKGFLDGLGYDLNGFLGAHPNAVTDSSGAFNAAFLAAKGGNMIRVPGGSAYTLSNPVTMQAGNVLQGVRQTPPDSTIVIGSRIILGANVDRLITQPTIHTVTITIGSPTVFHLANHGLTTANRVVVETTGALPTGILGQPKHYWVVNPTADTFQISETQNGAAINSSGTQSGVHTIVTNMLHPASIVGMMIDGKKATRSALALLDLSPVALELHNSSFNDGSNDCVHLRTNHFDAAWLNWVTNNTIFRCGGVGIYSEVSDSYFIANDLSSNGVGFEHFSSSSRLIGNQIEVSTDTGLVVRNLYGAIGVGTDLLVVGNTFVLNTNADIHYKVGNGISHRANGPVVGNSFIASGGIDIDNSVTDGVMVGNSHVATTSPNDIRFGGTNNTGWQIYGMSSEKTPANRFSNLPPDAQVLSSGPGGAFNRLQSLILSSVASGVRVADTRLNVFGSDTVLGAGGVAARFGVQRNDAGLDAALLVGTINGNAPFLDCANGELTTVAACAWRFKHNTAIRLDDNGVQFPVFGAFQNGVGSTYLDMNEITAPAAPSANKARIYAEDDGTGKTRLMVVFPTGAAQQIAIEP